MGSIEVESFLTFADETFLHVAERGRGGSRFATVYAQFAGYTLLRDEVLFIACMLGHNRDGSQHYAKVVTLPGDLTDVKNEWRNPYGSTAKAYKRFPDLDVYASQPEIRTPPFGETRQASLIVPLYENVLTTVDDMPVVWFPGRELERFDAPPSREGGTM